jgi:hypothetical protein
MQVASMERWEKIMDFAQLHVDAALARQHSLQLEVCACITDATCTYNGPAAVGLRIFYAVWVVVVCSCACTMADACAPPFSCARICS